MKKIWLGLIASCLVMFATNSAMADHHSYGHGFHGGSPYYGRVQTFSPGAFYGSYSGYGGCNNFYRPHNTYYPGNYGYPAFGPGYRLYGNGYGSGIGFFIRF